MGITLTWDFSANNDTVDRDRLQTSLNELRAGLSQISAEDILTGAAIPQSKLGSISGNVEVEIPIVIHNWDGGWPNGAVTPAVIGCPVPVPSDDTWTVTSYRYVIKDSVTTPAGTFKLQHGYYNTGTGAWTNKTDIGTERTLADFGDDNHAGSETGLSVLLEATGELPGCIAVVSTSAASNLLQAGILNVTLTLQRSITL